MQFAPSDVVWALLAIKEGFDVFALAAAVDVDDQDPFDCTRHAHLADACIVASWFMLRKWLVR